MDRKVALQPEGCGFESTSSHCVATLDKVSHPLLSVRKATRNHLTHLIPRWRKSQLTSFRAENHHHDISVEQCWTIVNSNYPFLVASPDNLISCQCCGKGVVLVKLSFTRKHYSNGSIAFKHFEWYTEVSINLQDSLKKFTHDVLLL